MASPSCIQILSSSNMAGYDLFVWNMGKKTAHHQNSRMNSTGKCRYGRAFCLDYAPGFLLWQPDELHIGPLLVPSMSRF
ncbi:hypothetical protein V6N13_046964 [Hibiscus sabdariffa]